MNTAYDKLPQDQIKDINDKIRSVVRRFHGMYFKRLWDTRQTHAVYGVTESTMDSLKKELQGIGAYKFRKVKAHGHTLWILCFSAEKIK